MKVKISDVAKRAGVSTTTVSRILNGNYSHNKSTTRDKVLKAIKDLDYQPNVLAKGLKQMKTNTIGIVLSNLQNPFWISVLEGVEDACYSLGYSLIICNSNDSPVMEENHLKGLKYRQVDGMIVNATLKNKDLYHALLNDNYPLVSINREIYDLPMDMILTDNVKGTAEGIHHLLALGRTSIAFFVYPPEGVSPRIERIEGYKKALKEGNMDFDEGLIQIVEEKKGCAKEKVLALFRESKRPDAIFSTNNIMTLEILDGLKTLGLQIPHDISLIGYDETVWSMHVDPPLTTIKQPAYLMGELAAKRMIKRIESKRKLKPKKVILEPELKIRQSCGAGGK